MSSIERTTTGVPDLLTGLDIYDRRTGDHINDVVHQAHSGCPVAYSDAHGGYYLVAGHAHVVEALCDDHRFSSRGGKSIPERQTVEMPPLDSDPPEHREYRRLLNRFFSKGGLAPYEPAIRQVARDLLDDIVEAGQVEMVHGYAGPLSGAVLCRVILDLDDTDLMAQAQQRVAKIANANTAEAWRELTAFLQKLLSEYEPGDRDDVLRAIVTGTINGRPLSDEEKMGIVVVLFLGGLDTTRAAIASIAYHIATQPHLQDRLRDTDWTRKDSQ